MDKLNKLLQSAYVNQYGVICIRVGRKNLYVSLQTFRELQACYDALQWFETYETINKTVFEVCLHCGIEAKCKLSWYVIGNVPWWEGCDK